MKITSKQTPGPWQVDGFAVTGPGWVRSLNETGQPLKSEPVCRVTAKDDEAVDRANARLIAAAPDMLEALKAFMELANDDTNSTDLHIHLYNVAEAKAKSAIAKAEGDAA